LLDQFRLPNQSLQGGSGTIRGRYSPESLVKTWCQIRCPVLRLPHIQFLGSEQNGMQILVFDGSSIAKTKKLTYPR
jgi:hypothetical protein